MLSAGVILTIHHISFFFISFLFPWDFSPQLQLESSRSKEWQEILNTDDKILDTFQQSWNLSYSVLPLLTRAGLISWT